MAHAEGRTTKFTEWLGLETLPQYWHHNDIRFDVLWSSLSLRPGEEELTRFEDVEDTKGNKGILGLLALTNMRVLWSVPGRRVNLSIGWDCINSVVPGKTVHNQSGKQVYLLGFCETPFEFIFTSDDPGLVASAEAVFNAYTKSKMYREVTLQGKITDSQGHVRLLRDEKVFDQIDGVFHLSGDEGVIGTIYITNIRLLWHSALDSSMNSSIPYLETTHIQLKDSKYGKTLTIDAKSKIRQFHFGFRIDPPQEMVRACQEIKNLWKLYHERPIFGVNMESTDSDSDNSFVSASQKLSDADDEESRLTRNLASRETLSQSLNMDASESVSTFVYDSYLGLAIEPLQQGVTTKDLWHQTFDNY